VDFKRIRYLKQFFDCLDRWGLVRRDPFGNPIGMKRIVVFVLGWLTYARLSIYNRTEIKGTEKIQDLPREGVLFLSNHQTYFMDVICFYLFEDSIGEPLKFSSQMLPRVEQLI
jgi:1-acyl-sn-glycerol-3-phosphate acyltransferase